MKIEILEFVSVCEKILNCKLSFSRDESAHPFFICIYNQDELVAEISENDMSVILYTKYFPELAPNLAGNFEIFNFDTSHEKFVSFYKHFYK